MGCFAVAPYAGAWIEIVKNCALNLGGVVAPYAGAWIEIDSTTSLSETAASLPTRERGLKL